ncbi:sodium/potassium-transporting ATPase subunit beta-like [Oppia nitens]|uniref:sodium/potassium-transporting ATPase subunit beta-like n=1 Tax=Oppia nitens TaxID=1686743 RepID=UPI0023DB4D53|nr:sodium/potassium-transporting ATPase subunit beta-like [Oppia nitens]
MDEMTKKEEEANEDTPLKPTDNDVEAGAGAGDADGQTDIGDIKDNEKSVMAGGGGGDEKLATDGGGVGGGGKQSTSALLDQRKVKLILAILGAVLLVLLLLIVAILVIIYRDGWEEDKTYRFIRMIPKPNRPQNLLYFRHGQIPYEGRVWPDLVDQLDQFVHNYNPDINMRTKNVTDCYGTDRSIGSGAGAANTVTDGHHHQRTTACFFDLKTIAKECSRGDFGYSMGTPCVFIQFNNISNWLPELYTDEDYLLDEQLPATLRTLRPRMVFLECKGNSVVDNENMGPIEYTPTQGFATHYFPYTGHPHYMPPFVALRFKAPATSVAIGITCRLYAKNLGHNLTDSDDSVVDSGGGGGGITDRGGGQPVPSLPFNLFIE